MARELYLFDESWDLREKKSLYSNILSRLSPSSQLFLLIIETVKTAKGGTEGQVWREKLLFILWLIDVIMLRITNFPGMNIQIIA
ncbi:hypothetical protein JW926_04975 [Candidatus Sumerlaeota bacterium]|nr:hypothetical protein [Candidatus Sumerlaeota bacterium]